MNQIIEEAKGILKGELELPEGRQFRDIIQALKGELEFASARRLLARARDKVPDESGSPSNWLLVPTRTRN